MKKEGDRDGQRERVSAAQTLDLRSFGAAFATSRVSTDPQIACD